MLNICILCAIPQETRPILAKLPRGTSCTLAGFKTWQIASAGKYITIIESGVGQNNAGNAAATAALQIRPDLIISAGFCGAVTAGFLVGDIVTADAIYRLASGSIRETITPEANFTETAFQGLAPAVYLSADSIYSKPEVRNLSQAPHKAVIEMESYAVASTCREHQIPFIAVRAVSDAFDTDPSHLFRAISDKNFTISWHSVLRAVIRKPALLCQLPSLANGARLAGNSLAQVMANALEKL